MTQIIPARNVQQALVPLLQALHTTAEDIGEDLVFTDPVVFRFRNPRERLVFFPGFRRNPAQELSQSMQSLVQAEGNIQQAADAVVAGAGHFLFSTPQLVVRGDIGTDGRFNLTAILADTNPFTGALGQIGLQMSILQELLANAAKKSVGELTIQHMGVRVPLQVVKNLMKAALDNDTSDPYDGDLKPRKIDGPLEMKMLVEEGDQATGYKSKWLRHVALPLFACLKAETVEEALELTKKIKTEDWKRSMIDWLQAVKMSQDYAAAQKEAAGDGEA